MIETLKQTTSEIYNWTKDKIVRFKEWLVILICGAVVVAAPLVIPPQLPDIALENIQADYHASELKDKYRLEKTAFILDAVDENAIQAEVGNKNSDSFEPSLTLRKWNDEVNFKVKYKHGEKEKDQKVDIENKKIKWKGKKVEVHYYDIKKGELLHDKVLESDVYEVEVILLEKPDTNIVGFDIETQGLSFYYQPALNLEDNPEADYCTETQCFKDEIVVSERPENVVGSYAVYHESKVGDYHLIAGKNYMAGKAFHIYRPKIIDSAGTEVWGKLNITDNLLTVEIPQEFLDNAVYPVRHAAGLTFGFESIGGSSAGLTAGTIRGFYHFAPAGGNGTATKLTAYVYNYLLDQNSNIRGVIYLDSDNSLITYGSQVTLNNNPTWTDLDITNSSITNGIDYLLGYWIGTNNVSCKYDSIAGFGIIKDNETYHATNSPPSTLAVDADNSPYKVSIYCTYTAGGAAARRMFLVE